MTPKELIDILGIAARLKTNTRHCWTDGDRKESVADHSWRIALMAMLLGQEEEFAGTDIARVMKMCLIHDLGEAFTGDIPTFLKSSSDEEKEDEIFQRWVDTFPAAQRTEWKSLLEEMKEMRTTEAKLWKALDKTEALISHNESDIATWLPLEYDLQRTYGTEQVQFSSYMREFKKEIDLWTERKIEEEGNRTDSL